MKKINIIILFLSLSTTYTYCLKLAPEKDIQQNQELESLKKVFSTVKSAPDEKKRNYIKDLIDHKRLLKTGTTQDQEAMIKDLITFFNKKTTTFTILWNHITVRNYPNALTSNTHK